MTKTNDDARGNIPGIIKIIGIGQSLRGDDAAGLAAVRLWQETYQTGGHHPNIQVELTEVPGVGLLNLLEGVEITILVDAVRSGAEAGTIHVVPEEHLELFSSGAGSAHGWGVAETLALGHQVMPESMPKKISIIGIEANDVSMSTSLSQVVVNALPEVACLIEHLINQD